MPYQLLETKLFVPPQRANRINRPRLLAKLDHGLSSNCRLNLVSAPAGFGKTTLVCDWAQKTGLPISWLSLDEGDNDPGRFWKYVIAGLQRLNSSLGVEMAAALQSTQPPPLENLIISLINDLTTYRMPFLLVMDDYHLVVADEVQRTVGYFIDHIPPNVHMVLLTRADPPLHLARRRGRGELCEVRAIDLRFNIEEIRDFLQQTMQLSMPASDIEALEARTEGWIAGLQMVAIAAQDLPDVHDFVSALTGDDRYIADYLVEEVLQRQSKEVRDFLLNTSILTRLSASLCSYVLAEDPTGLNELDRSQLISSEQMAATTLEYLERANLFVIPLDNKRIWFRYHHLFAQLLQQHLHQEVGDEGVRRLYQRASQWHQCNGNPIEGVTYALAGGLLEQAACQIEPIIESMFINGQLMTLAHYGEILPDNILGKHPRLAVGIAWAASATNQNDLCARMVRLVEIGTAIKVQEFLALQEVDREQLPLEIMGAMVELSVISTRLALDNGDLSSVLSKFAQVSPYLIIERDKLPHIFNLPSMLRPPMVFMLSSAEKVQGNFLRALAGFEEAARTGLSTGNIHIISLALGNLGMSQLELGDYQMAEVTFGNALQAAKQHGGEQISAMFGLSHVGLAIIAYERNDIQAARREAEHGIGLGRWWNNWETLMPGYQILALVCLAENDFAGAGQALASLKSIEAIQPAVLSPLVLDVYGLIWSKQGDFKQVAKWANMSGYHLDQEISPAKWNHALLLADWLVSQGDPERAQTILEKQSTAVSAQGQWGIWLGLQTRLAKVLSIVGQNTKAVEILIGVLNRAKPQGILRVFMDEGQPMYDLLQQIRKEGMDLSMSAYIDEILAIFPHPDTTAQAPISDRSPVSALVEGVTPRELEMLTLLSQAYSNAEIAKKAYISLNTVKKHISSIYGKLGVTTRIEAVEKARSLHLI
jgi:LuxR family maltose regulon positive regulatory protein